MPATLVVFCIHLFWTSALPRFTETGLNDKARRGTSLPDIGKLRYCLGELQTFSSWKSPAFIQIGMQTCKEGLSILFGTSSNASTAVSKVS